MNKINIRKICITFLASFSAISASEIFAANPPAPAPNIPRALPVPLPTARPPEIKQEEKPALQPSTSEKDVKLTINKFEFAGNFSVTDEQLSSLLKSYQHREIGLAELNQATKIITNYYRQKGFFLAQAYLPEQDVKESALEIVILEGELNELAINTAEGLNENFLTEMATYRLRAGDTVSEDNLVRNVTLLNSLPGIEASTQLSPGEKTGATNVSVDFIPLPRAQSYLSADTYGNQFTGREVINAGLRLNNLIGVGDQFSVNLKRSNNEGQRGAQLGFYTPIHASGTLLSLSYSYVDYKLGGSFDLLGASGDSQYFNIGFDQPVMRDSQKGLFARFNVTHQKINDEVATIFLENRRNINSIDIGLLGDWTNKNGDAVNQLGINIRSGNINFKNDFAKVSDALLADTQGSFAKLTLDASRTQYFSNGLSIGLHADYQAANKNLDAVEKIAIGGIDRWRAFSELPSLADSGLMVGVEIRKGIVVHEPLARLLLEGLSPYGFIDVGRGKINQDPADNNDNHVKSIHYGLGMDLAFANEWLLDVLVSHQNRDFENASAENETRFWGRLQKSF